MFGINGLFETHLTVTDLSRSVDFYRDVLKLPFAHAFPKRGVAFFWIGTPGHAMLGLWQAPSTIRLRLHLAFTVSLDDLMTAPPRLREAGIEPRDFHQNPCDTPSVFAWMPAASIYFRDPDDHSLELLSMLPGPAREELGVVSWSQWEVTARGKPTAL